MPICNPAGVTDSEGFLLKLVSFYIHFLFSPVDVLKHVDFASADQDSRGR